MILLVAGGGGVGKGTLVQKILDRDPRLHLSRSWTTRGRREGEAADAYTFVDEDAFRERIGTDGFLEHAEIAGNLYGTPWPQVPEGHDLVLEIDVQGAEQVRERHPDTVVVLIVAPSREEQAERLRRRGDDEASIDRRLELTRDEEAKGQTLADHIVVNDDLDRAVAEVARILEDRRATPGDN